MADRYWVGGTGTWSSTDTTNWSTSSGGAGGASVPTSADNVFFNVNSNVGTGAFTVMMVNTPRVCNDITISGLDGTMTLAGTSIGLTVSGSLEFPVTRLTRTYTGTTTFNATTTGKTITTNGVAFGGAVIFNGVGGAWTLGSAFSCGTSDLTLTNGTFDTSVSNYSVTAASFFSNNSNARTINLNGSTLTFSTSGVSWNIATSTNATLNAGTSTIALSGSGTFAGGGLTYYNVSFTSTAASVLTKSIAGANIFNNLTFSTIGAVGLNNITIDANQTINGTFTINGANGSQRQFIRSDVTGTSRTLTCAAIASTTDVDFRDITIAGAHGTLSGTRLGDCKGNTNITFGAGKTVYYRQTGSANWGATGSGSWSATSGGALDATQFPLAQDTAVFPAATYPASGSITTINANYNIGTIDMSLRTSNTMTLTISSVGASIYGNWINGTGTTLSGTGALTFAGQTTQQITSSAKTFTQPITINSPSGSVTLQDALITSQTTLLAQGTLDLNNLTLTTFVFSSSTSTTRTIAFGTGNITCTATGTVWNTTTVTNLTTTGTPVVNVTSTGSTAITVNPGALSEANSISYNFTGGTYALTFLGSSSHTARNVDFTGYAGTWQATGSSVVVYGNLTLSTGMSLTATANTFRFGATSGTKTITSNGKIIDFTIPFNGAGGAWQLQDAMTLGSTRAVSFTNGTVDLNGFTLTSGTGVTGLGTKNITFNGGTLLLSGSGATAWNNAQPTGFTTTAGTGTGTISMTAATAKTFVGGGSTYNCTLNQGGAGTLTITGANTFNDIANTNATASQITFPASTTTTVNAFTLSGSSGNLVSIRSSTPSTRFTLSKSSGTVSVSFLDIQDSNATGGATWSAPTSNGNVDSGNNLGWSFVAGNYVDASADVTADATVTGSALRVRLFAGDISAAAALASVASRIRLFSGDINANASVEGQAVRVRVASGDITGNAIVAGIGNITAGGAANISGFAEVSAYGSATYSFNALVTANADVIANGQIIGEEWGDAATTSSTWTDTTPASSTWQPDSQSSNTWLRQ